MNSFEVLSIRDGYAVQYHEYLEKRNYNHNSKLNLLQYQDKKPQENPYNGYMSTATKKKCRKYIATWVKAFETAKENKTGSTLPYFTFVTLTLSDKQKHTDNEIKRELLSRFIDECTRKKMFKNYFWRAEKQGNGNIHFHLLIDSSIHYMTLRKVWNYHQSKLGYTDSYTNKMKSKYKNGFFYDSKMKRYNKKTKTYTSTSYSSQIKAFQFGESTNWTQPNSTDIRKIDKIKNLTSYLLKYLTKTEKELTESERKLKTVEGRIYGKSKQISELKPYTTIIDREVSEWLENCVTSGIRTQDVYTGGDKLKKTSYCCMFFGDMYQHLKKSASLLRDFTQYHLDVFRNLYPSKLTTLTT